MTDWGVSIQDFAPKRAFMSVNHSLKVLQKVARQQKWCLAWDDCHTEPLLLQRKMHGHFAVRRLMVSKTKSEIHFLTLHLFEDVTRELLHQLLQLFTTNH